MNLFFTMYIFSRSHFLIFSFAHCHLRDTEQDPTGRVTFDCEMEHCTELTVILTEVRLSGLPPQNDDGTTDCFLQYNFTGGCVLLSFVCLSVCLFVVVVCAFHQHI